MYVSHLALRGFRNYINETVELSPGINVIKGKNAQGKSSLLEAIAFLSLGRSFRAHSDRELINTEASRAYIHARVMEGSIATDVEALIEQGAKSVKINAMPIRRLGELFGNVLTVVFSPDDLTLIKDSPGHRRRFVDSEISKVSAAYYYDLQSYYKVLRQKNALLKQRNDSEKIRSLISVYNGQLASLSASIMRRRRIFIDGIEGALSRVYSSIASTDDSVTIRYKPCIEDGDVEKALYDKYERAYRNELEQGTTLYGVHREDIYFGIEDREARLYASQGQLRTLVVSLKLCVADMLERIAKHAPIILLDDIFSELDVDRQAGLLRAVGENQLIITTALPSLDILNDRDKRVFTVEDGAIVR